MKKFCQRIGGFKKALQRTVEDWLAAAGASLVRYGVYQIYIPAGWITAGVFLLITAVLWSRGMAGEGQ